MPRGVYPRTSNPVAGRKRRSGKGATAGCASEGGGNAQGDRAESGVARNGVSQHAKGDAPPGGARASPSQHGADASEFSGRQRAPGGGESLGLSGGVEVARLDTGVRHSNEGARNDAQSTSFVQGRSGKSEDEDSSGNGRSVASADGSATSGLQETEVLVALGWKVVRIPHS